MSTERSLNQYLKKDSENLPIDVGTATTPEDILAAQQLIKTVLYDPNGFIFSTASDEEEQTKYVVAKDQEKVIGAGRLRLNPHWEEAEDSGLLSVLEKQGLTADEIKDKIAWFYGLVLDEEYQKKGISSKLYEKREAIAREHGKNIFVARIRPDAWPIYDKRGYQDFGGEQLTLAEGIITRRFVYKLDPNKKH